MCDTAQVLLVLFFGGAGLTLARRFRNSATNMGEGIAAWTMILIVLVIIKFLFPHIELPVK